MSVDIEPFELSFQRPFTTEVSQILRLKNPNTVPVAFKVKTTAPKQYCVRPNAGRIEPGQDFDVTVLLQAMKQEPPADAKCRDKFLVQSAPITSDKEFASIANVLDHTEKGQLQEKKIRVNWLAAVPDVEQSPSQPILATPNKPTLSNGAHDTPDVSRTFSSPGASEEATPSTAPPPYKTEITPAEDDNEDHHESKSIISNATTAITSAGEATIDELKAKLAQAEAQITSLKESGIRQRNVKAAAETEKPAVARTNQAVKQTIEGVPVQMAALLCLVSFLLAYLFF